MSRYQRGEKRGFTSQELIISVVIIAILAIVILSFNRQKATISTTNTTSSATPATTAAPTTTTATGAAVDPRAGWKTKTLSELGVSFQYPAEWTGFDLIKRTETPQSGTAWGGDLYATSTGTGPLQPENYLPMSILAKNYREFGDTTLSTMVDATWTKAQYAAAKQVEATDILYYQSIANSKALLVGTYSNIECSPGFVFTVIAPLTTAYPNLWIGLPYASSKEPAIVAYEKEATAKGLDACDELAVYQGIAAKWATNGLPKTVQDALHTATLLVESITKS